MFISCLFVCLIHFVISLSSQEDLSITKYSHIGCLILKSDKQYLVNNIQENFLLPYQTFTSSSMSVELCFRLCRRWIILMFNNQTNCICLYTITRPYELHEYLGEYISIDKCTLNHVEIYSLTDDVYILPSLISAPNEDWSFDGCYYLHGIQTLRPNMWLNHLDYIQAIDACRIHCHRNHQLNYTSYFLSRKKSCYCVPIQFFQTTKSAALRKPLIHCSFLPYICHRFLPSCERFYSDTHIDTLIKINVQNYCVSSNFVSFTFDRILYLCLKSVSLHTQINFPIIIYDQKCLPLIIETYEQWNYLIQSSWITHSRSFIWIHRNSTYIFNDLFKSQNITISSDDLCIVVIRTNSNKISFDIIQCTAIQSPGDVLCVQKPFQSPIIHEDDFQMITNVSDDSIDEILSCPENFVLFNKICYYIHSSFIYNIQSGERLCYNQNSNSTLVKFDSHEWANINPTKFLGRMYNDILLEFFYYLLEKKLLKQSINGSNTKHWLRLLIGDKNDPNECVLRYFTRASGAFSIFYRCNNGGHPVCQCEPIRTKIPIIISINETISNINISQTESTVTPTTVTTTTTEIVQLNSTNETIPLICDENCTINSIADEDLINNESRIDFDFNTTNIDAPLKKAYAEYRPLILILTGPVLAIILLSIGTGLLLHYLRQNRGSYSTASSITSHRRNKRSSTVLTVNDLPNTPAVLYTRLSLNPPRQSITETDMLLPLDNSIQNDDSIELLPATKIQIISNENKITEIDEDPSYATLK